MEINQRHTRLQIDTAYAGKAGFHSFIFQEGTPTPKVTGLSEITGMPSHNNSGI